MKNTFWPHTGRVLVQGLLLLCLRLAQNRTGFDPVTGLSVRSVPGLALIACLLLCALAELILCRKLSGERGNSPPTSPRRSGRRCFWRRAVCFWPAAGRCCW